MAQLFNLIEYTHRSVFLTGKAGTGKTTFLGEFVKKTKKKFVVAAPTGIAAINAGGVTLHSLFGLPLKTHIPTYDDVDPNEANNIGHLAPHFKYRRDKLKLLRQLEILIVDEVSMLRCDVLDMIDLALRVARRNSQKFGGVQLLLIGDLYQLPPVVKEEEASILYRYYPSPFFFNALALNDYPLHTIELKTVYRQTDAVFLQMLNAIRDNDFNAIDFDLLNSRYQPNFEPSESYIYLTSHNYLADAINQKNLEALKGAPRTYKATVEGDFKPHLYPNDEGLRLKPGTQVMFIRNDNSEAKRYFNGKLATVTELLDEFVKVLPAGEEKEMLIERETWEHKRYFLNNEMQIEAETVGSYVQFPIRLAWAVTIHKSQGLTFDRVIIDAGQSFTAGQVYVALSRCRSLEGIVLKSRITSSVILTDDRIALFQQETDSGNDIESILEQEKYQYAVDRLLLQLDPGWLRPAVNDWHEAAAESRFLKQKEVFRLTESLIGEAVALTDVFKKFEVFIRARMKPPMTPEGAWLQIEQKSSGATQFFFENIESKFFAPAKQWYAESKGGKGLKGYNQVLKSLLDDLENYLNNLRQLTLLGKKLFLKTLDVKIINQKIEKKPSHLVSYELLEEGLSVPEIAAAREMTTGTILSHLARMATAGVLDIDKLFSADQLASFGEVFEKQSFENLTQWKAALPDSFEFDEIRVLLNYFNYQKKKKEKPG